MKILQNLIQFHIKGLHRISILYRVYLAIKSVVPAHSLLPSSPAHGWHPEPTRKRRFGRFQPTSVTSKASSVLRMAPAACHSLWNSQRFSPHWRFLMRSDPFSSAQNQTVSCNNSAQWIPFSEAHCLVRSDQKLIGPCEQGFAFTGWQHVFFFAFCLSACSARPLISSSSSWTTNIVTCYSAVPAALTAPFASFLCST